MYVSQCHWPAWDEFVIHSCFTLFSYKQTDRLFVCLLPGVSAWWTDHRGAGDLGGHWRWRHGGLGQGRLPSFAAQFVATDFSSLACLGFFRVSSPFVFLTSRPETAAGRWDTSRRNTCSCLPPTACWACCSRWLRSTPAPTPPATPPNLKWSCQQARSTETPVVRFRPRQLDLWWLKKQTNKHLNKTQASVWCPNFFCSWN